jgi:hypothetical protein
VRDIAVVEERSFALQDIEALVSRPEPLAKRQKLGPRDFRKADRNSDPIASHLEVEFSRFMDASAAFPPIITPEIDRACLSNYLQAVDDLADRGSCGVCGAMVQSADLERILCSDPILARNRHEFDTCAVEYHPTRKEEAVAVDLCAPCLRSIRASGSDSIPKFSGGNDINTTLCQHYPDCLRDLTMIEQFFISRAHLIGYVLRLSQKGKPGISYRSAAVHIMAFKQDPSELLRILPSVELDPHQFVTVSWEGGKRPLKASLLRFCQVRNSRVLAALQWLCANNPIYKDVTINTSLLDTWSDEPFIPPSLLDDAAVTGPGLSDNRDGYARDTEGDEEDAALDVNMDVDLDLDLDAADKEEAAYSSSSVHDPISIATGAFLTDHEGHNISTQKRNAMSFA